MSGSEQRVEHELELTILLCIVPKWRPQQAGNRYHPEADCRACDVLRGEVLVMVMFITIIAGD